MQKRFLVVLLLLATVLISTGCSTDSLQAPIDPNGGIWDRYFVYPLSVALDYFAELLGGNYGLSIIIVTILVRILVMPLMVTQIKSSKAMQELQPEIKKINEKYKDDPKKKQEETMKLFQEHNVNPLAGCLPILIQMPILIAFYHAIMRNEYIAEAAFLGIQLGDPDPYYILPALAALTTYLQTKMMGTGLNTTKQAAQQQKIMQILMPGMIFIIGISLPAALSLYWVISNTFTIIQTRLIKGTK